MIGSIFKDIKLAFEHDGYWCFEGKAPHEYWCAIGKKDDIILLCPVIFNFVDNLPNEIVDAGTYQIHDGDNIMTLIIGRCIHCTKEQLNTDPIAYINPLVAKKVCLKLYG